jgi:dephospho-CoA kinase
VYNIFINLFGVIFLKVIGLCGGSGSGKGTAAKMFYKYGIHSIDTDAVYHDLISKKSACVDALVEKFGRGILNPNGESIDRIKLADVVFGSKDAKENRRQLNLIAHKHILDRVREILKAKNSENVSAVLIDAPLLFESGFDKECDLIISIISEKSIRMSRIIKRDNITSKKAELRINSQISDEILRQKSDFVIENNGTAEELEEKVGLVVKEILNK